MTIKNSLSLFINGSEYTGEVETRLTLLDFIRDELDLTGTHTGCEHGVCGACTVLLNDTPVRSCLIFAVQLSGQNLTTIEGIGEPDGSLSPLQKAFCDLHGMQCGYCTPGMLIAAHSLLEHNSDPTDDEIRDAISGNLCRCTGYTQIIDAIKFASAIIRLPAPNKGERS